MSMWQERNRAYLFFFCFFAPISAYTKRENNFSKIERKKEVLVIEEKTDVLYEKGD